jgi:hypothetical protein
VSAGGKVQNVLIQGNGLHMALPGKFIVNLLQYIMKNDSINKSITNIVSAGTTQVFSTSEKDAKVKGSHIRPPSVVLTQSVVTSGADEGCSSPTVFKPSTSSGGCSSILKNTAVSSAGQILSPQTYRVKAATVTIPAVKSPVVASSVSSSNLYS